jgi:hypothetical protein
MAGEAGTVAAAGPARAGEAGRAPKPRGFIAPRSLRIVYLNVPKSGCTTVKNVLHRLDSGAWLDDPLTIHRRKDVLLRGDRHPEEIARRLGEDPVFTFVRHPLRRAYSCFCEKIHFQSDYSFPEVRKAIAADYGARFEAQPSAERHRENFKAFLRFARDSFEGRNGWRRDPHWCPQSMVLTHARRWRAIDFIGRVERLGEHLELALGLAGAALDVAVPRMNEGPPPPWPYEAMLDGEARALGAELFADDFRSFGYSL